jgi:hypothetical protein
MDDVFLICGVKHYAVCQTKSKRFSCGVIQTQVKYMTIIPVKEENKCSDWNFETA